MMRRLPVAALLARQSQLINGSANGLKCVRQAARRPSYRAASTSSSGNAIPSKAESLQANAQLRSLQEITTGEDLAGRGRRSEAVPLLERAVDICARSMGGESALARAALHRLATVLYDDQRFSAAEEVLTRGGDSAAGKALPTTKAGLLLLSKAQLFEGKVSEAVQTCSRAVELCEQDEDHTPDTDALGQALRQLGATQMLLQGAADDAETSLLRAARLGSSGTDQGKGLSVLAAFNVSAGGEQRIEEAVGLWNEAFATTKAAVKELETTADPSNAAVSESDDVAHATTSAAIRLSRASILCSAAQGELILGRGTTKASEYLAEALKMREELLATGHPATAWTLALLGRCHLVAGEAVTAEGLLRAALDGLGTIGEEASGTSATNLVGGVTASPLDLFPSPLHPFSKAESLRAYSELLMQWEKREAEGEGVLRRAEKVESSLRLKPPGGVTVHMLHLDDVY